MQTQTTTAKPTTKAEKKAAKAEKKALKLAAKAEKKVKKDMKRAEKFNKLRADLIDTANKAFDTADNALREWKKSFLAKLPKNSTEVVYDFATVQGIESEALDLRDAFRAAMVDFMSARKAAKALDKKSTRRMGKLVKKAKKQEAKKAAKVASA